MTRELKAVAVTLHLLFIRANHRLSQIVGLISSFASIVARALNWVLYLSKREPDQKEVIGRI